MIHVSDFGTIVSATLLDTIRRYAPLPWDAATYKVLESPLTDEIVITAEIRGYRTNQIELTHVMLRDQLWDEICEVCDRDLFYTPASEIDWRPTETIPEDYYAF